MPAVTNRLRSALEAAGLTQADLAALTGLPYATIKRMVRAGSNPLLPAAHRVSAVLEVPVEELFQLAPAHDR